MKFDDDLLITASLCFEICHALVVTGPAVIQVIDEWSGGKDHVFPKIPIIPGKSFFPNKNILNSSILLS